MAEPEDYWSHFYPDGGVDAAEFIVQSNATFENGTFTICSHGDTCGSQWASVEPYPASKTKTFIFGAQTFIDSLYNLQYNQTPTCYQFNFEIFDVNGEKTNKRGGWKGKQGGNGSRRYRQTDDPNDPCPGDFVTIIEPHPLDHDPESGLAAHVILDRTCNRHREPLTLRSLTDYIVLIFRSDKKEEGNGKGFKLVAEPVNCSVPRSESCLWDCEWRENPFYQLSSLWRFGGWTGTSSDCENSDRLAKNPDKNPKSDTDNCVRVQFTMAKIPKDLRCLDDCFFELDSKLNRDRTYEEEEDKKPVNYERKCVAAFPAENKDTSNDKRIDCILLNRVDKRNTISLNERRCIFPESKIIAMAGKGRDIVESDSDPSCDSSDFAGGDQANAIKNFVPTEPMDIALMFCIMANLDARRRLPSPEGFPFYADEPIWSKSLFKTCDSFLPKIFTEQPTTTTTTTTPAGTTTTTTSRRNILAKNSDGPFSGIKFNNTPLGRISTTRSDGPTSAQIQR